MSSPAWYQSRGLKIAVGVAVTLACLWYAVRDIAPADVTEAFARARYGTLPIMWAALAVFYWLKAWRWRMLLTPVGQYKISYLVPSMMAGFAFNNILPARLGEFVRIFAFARQSGQSRTAVLTSIAVERLFDLVAVLIFLTLGLFYVEGIDQAIRARTPWLAGATLLAVLIAFAYVVWTEPIIRAVEATMSRVPGVPDRATAKISTLLDQGAVGLGSLRNVFLLAGVIVTSLLQWALNGFVVALSLYAFDLPASPAIAALLLGVVALGVTVPAVPGYFGVIQLCFWTVLQLFTDAKADVFASSIYFQLSQYVPVTLIGLVAFARMGIKVGKVKSAAADATASAGDPAAAKISRAEG